MVAERFVVDEADELISEFPVLEDLVRDETPEFARPGNQNPLEADAGAPAPLERFANELARRVGEPDVQDEEDQPDDLRDFEDAAILRGAAGEIGLCIERGDHPEDNGE